MIALENVLVATDFGSASDTAIRYGRALAERFGAKLHVLHVSPDAYLTAAMGYAYAKLRPSGRGSLSASRRGYVSANIAVLGICLAKPRSCGGGKPARADVPHPRTFCSPS
jgi:nucleotide-binding universal stress UspA family protein